MAIQIFKTAKDQNKHMKFSFRTGIALLTMFLSFKCLTHVLTKMSRRHNWCNALPNAAQKMIGPTPVTNQLIVHNEEVFKGLLEYLIEMVVFALSVGIFIQNYIKSTNTTMKTDENKVDTSSDMQCITLPSTLPNTLPDTSSSTSSDDFKSIIEALQEALRETEPDLPSVFAVRWDLGAIM